MNARARAATTKAATTATAEQTPSPPKAKPLGERVGVRGRSDAAPNPITTSLASAFDLLATAPQGVAKLRELILTLAVRGKLVAQNASDIPAAELLKQISVRRRQLQSDRHIHREFDTLNATRDAPLDIPTYWEWTSVARVFDIEYGKSLPAKDRRNGDVPVYGSNGIVGFHDSALVTEPSLVIGRKGSVGAVNVAPKPFWPIDTCYFVTPPEEVELEYAELTFQSLNLAQHDKATAIPGINRNDIYGRMFGLPPFAEQKRIATRVEELMDLCDELEARGRLQDEQHARLVTTLFDALVASESPQELAANWQRVARHFDLLLDRPEAVDALEQTILQLAVRGLLVPQDSRDEPADCLLGRIRAETEQLVAAGQIKRGKHLPPVGDDEKLFEAPPGWVWARINHISDNRLGKMLDKAKNTGTLHPYLRNTNVQWHRIELDAIKELRLEDHELAEYRLAEGDLLVCEGGYPGRCAIWDKPEIEMFFQKALHRVRPLGGVMAKYLEICLRTDSDSGALGKYFTGATIKHFAGQELNRYAIPLPPLAEQHRIVARVEELRGLCADLRQRLQQARTTQSNLADALVSAVTQHRTVASD